MSQETDWTINNLPDPNAAGQPVTTVYAGKDGVRGEVRAVFTARNGAVFLAVELDGGGLDGVLCLRSPRQVTRDRRGGGS